MQSGSCTVVFKWIQYTQYKYKPSWDIWHHHHYDDDDDNDDDDNDDVNDDDRDNDDDDDLEINI